MLERKFGNKNKGFSILEIALLVIIVGVVASTALPKISGTLEKDVISVASTAGEFDSSVRQARAQWFSNGQSGAGRIQGFADGQVWSGDRGWPISYKTSEAPQSIDAVHCANIWNGIMRSADAPRASTEGESQWQAHARGRDECQFTASLSNKHHVITYSTKSGKVSYQ